MNSLRKLPDIIKDVGFDFSWEEEKVWSLKIPTESILITELEWHFDVPFWSKPNGYYDLKPIEVITFPETYQDEHRRIMDSDLKYPLDIMFWKNRWLLLDGLHRLAKAKVLKMERVNARKIPTEDIPKIKKG